ncbi:hypothetical protein [uncultured Methanobrevibacter sp.]|uniref:hypothetical protein n=1 Tax=uncultured Methanobrevibacter sp. TaxID=253161 RepID=UPI0025FD0AFF|nr:hypothetical protein [uncultured Methanobrevibacter sp.]
MRFEDCKFKGKHEIRTDVTKEIIIACRESIPVFNELNIFTVQDYIHLLLDESEYNVKGHYFYERSTNIRIPLKVFKIVAIEYILEHLDDFKLKYPG